MKERRGRFVKYDKQKVLEEIVGGKMSAGEIARKHTITRGMIYSLKYAAKKKNIIRDPVLRLDDLDTPTVKTEETAQEIYQLGKRFRDGELDDLEFYQAVKRLVL